jgi:hypothetical protein
MVSNAKHLTLSLTLLVLFTSVSFAQGNQNERFHWGIPVRPENSEMNALNMEVVRAWIREEPNTGSVIILVARLGRGETRRELNRRRLYNVAQRFTAVLGVPAEKVVAAEGERVDDFGRVEIYWNGVLAGALVARRNRDLAVTCCGPDEQYYPDRDAVERRQRLRRERRRRG